MAHVVVAAVVVVVRCHWLLVLLLLVFPWYSKALAFTKRHPFFQHHLIQRERQRRRRRQLILLPSRSARPTTASQGYDERQQQQQQQHEERQQQEADGIAESLIQLLKQNKPDESELLPLIQKLEDVTNYDNNNNKNIDIDDDDDDDDDDPDRFQKLLGSYKVAYTKTLIPNENPVGGKWTRSSSSSSSSNGLVQRFFPTRRRPSFQYILPTNSTGLGLCYIDNSNNNNNKNNNNNNNNSINNNAKKVVAEAVNVVSLEVAAAAARGGGSGGSFRITVILRGDVTPLSAQERNDTSVVCQPLSNLAVRAWFDSPRIILEWVKTNHENDHHEDDDDEKKKKKKKRKKNRRLLNIQLGPKSSVLLDTLFVNDRLRLGMGGRSGTRFVFVRCPSDDTDTTDNTDSDPLQANKEYQQFLVPSIQPLRQPKLVLALAVTCLVSTASLVLSGSGAGTAASAAVAGSSLGVAWRIVRTSVALLSGLLAVAIGLSTGGIERDRRRYDFFLTTKKNNNRR